MRIFAVGAEGVTGARLAAQLTGHGDQVAGTRGSPGNAGRVRGPGAGPAAAGRAACVRPRVAGGS